MIRGGGLAEGGKRERKEKNAQDTVLGGTMQEIIIFNPYCSCILQKKMQK